MDVTPEAAHDAPARTLTTVAEPALFVAVTATRSQTRSRPDGGV